MNPETNKFEPLTQAKDPDMVASKMIDTLSTLLRPNGQPVPSHWTTFTLGELVVIKNYTFRVAYIGESALLFEPIGVVSCVRCGLGELNCRCGKEDVNGQR